MNLQDLDTKNINLFSLTYRKHRIFPYALW